MGGSWGSHCSAGGKKRNSSVYAQRDHGRTASAKKKTYDAVSADERKKGGERMVTFRGKKQ